VFTSPEDIVLRKLVWYQMGGGVSDRQWLDILEVLQTQAPDLDRAYMRQWGARLGVAALLAEAEAAAASDAQPFDPDVPPAL